MNLDALNESPRLLLQAELKPVQGTRFQPTGFPDLGAAEYTVADGSNMLLLESTQSMANRLETACWDEGQGDLVPALQGLPYVKSRLPDGGVTASILEAHRLNSPYLYDATGYDQIQEAVGFTKDAPFDRRKLARALLRFDPNSLLHGIFLEKIGGVVRLPRALSAFIEAEDVTVASAGGVKFDRVQPTSAGDNTKYGSAKEGYGNVPYHRDEYTAKKIVAYFNLDLALLRGLGLNDAALRMMTALALYKIRRFLNTGLRLRTACDLDLVGEVEVQRPEGFELPTTTALEQALSTLIAECGPLFNEPRVLELIYAPAKKAARTKQS